MENLRTLHCNIFITQVNIPLCVVLVLKGCSKNVFLRMHHKNDPRMLSQRHFNNVMRTFTNSMNCIIFIYHIINIKYALIGQDCIVQYFGLSVNITCCWKPIASHIHYYYYYLNILKTSSKLIL